MSKNKYTIEPLTKILINYIAKHNNEFDNDTLNELPNSIKNQIDVSIQEQNNIFINEAFTDLEDFHNKLPYTKKFNFKSYDKIYFMYKLRNNPDLVINSGYTKYLFNLFINNDTGDLYGGDSIYTLTITHNETGKTGIYETNVGRFD
jgi:hypothetical protein